MSRIYRRLTDNRRAVLVKFTPAHFVLGKLEPAYYILCWLDTGEAFTLEGRDVVNQYEHVEEAGKVEVGR